MSHSSENSGSIRRTSAASARASSSHDLGAQALKGVAAPARVYRVLGESGVQGRLDVVSPRGLTPLVGRETEVAVLRERWAQARDGLGQIVFLSGEAGIGKSRLVMALKEHVAGGSHTRWECRCSPYFRDSALYPMIDLSQRALQFGRDESPEAKLQKIEAALGRYGLAQPETVALWAALLSVPLADAYPPLTLTPQRQKQKTLEAIVAWLLALAVMDATEERSYEAKLHRLQGELLLAHAMGHDTEAETCFCQALDIAHRQQAKSLELRAAMSLSRPWQRQGKRDAARTSGRPRC